MVLHKGDHVQRVAEGGYHANPQQGAQPVEELEAAVGEAGNARHRRQKRANEREETPGQQRQQAMPVEHAGRALMILMRQLRQPAFHDARVAQPAAL